MMTETNVPTSGFTKAIRGHASFPDDALEKLEIFCNTEGLDNPLDNPDVPRPLAKNVRPLLILGEAIQRELRDGGKPEHAAKANASTLKRIKQTIPDRQILQLVNSEQFPDMPEPIRLALQYLLEQ